VIRGALETVAYEMSVHVSLAATTPIINQSNERNATILDADGRLAALSVGIPQLMLTAMGPVRFAIEFFGRDGFSEGDVLAANDSYHGGGHLPDWNVFAPVFCDGELQLFCSIQCHHADTGGAVPGGYVVDALDIWAEGLRCPVVKLVEAGRERRDVVYMLQTNNRVPTYIGDLRAQIGAATLGARRLKAIMERRGAATVRAAIDRMIELSGRRFRDEVASWPDGVYEATSMLEHDPAGNQDIKVHCKVTVDGDRLEIDYSDSDKRNWLKTNGTLANTRGMVVSQLATMVDPSIPKNEGIFSAIDLVVPSGTVVNPEPGQPVSAGTHHPGIEVAEALTLALSQAIPQRCVPQVYKIAIPTVIFGTNSRTGQMYIDHSVDTCACYNSAPCGQDAWGAIPINYGNLMLASCEINETLFPHRIWNRDMTPDTGGAGLYRGGPGSLYEKEITEYAMVHTWVLGTRYPVPGIAGGRPGALNKLELRVGSSDEFVVHHTAFMTGHMDGERIRMQFGGGGGWGDPLERDPGKVLEDVLDEYVTIEGAARDYGVVITGSLEALDLAVDADATASLRERLRSNA
jgi:N-methylhydantoinase B